VEAEVEAEAEAVVWAEEEVAVAADFRETRAHQPKSLVR
jgi:hypothetical protein